VAFPFEAVWGLRGWRRSRFDRHGRTSLRALVPTFSRHPAHDQHTPLSKGLRVDSLDPNLLGTTR